MPPEQENNQTPTPSTNPTPPSTPYPTPTPDLTNNPAPFNSPDVAVASPVPTVPIESATATTATIISSSVTDEPPKKSKKPLIIVAIIIAILLVIGGGFAAFAAYKNNPNTVLYDMVENVIKSKTAISSGSLEIKSENESYPGNLSVTFDTKTDSQKPSGIFNSSVKAKFESLDIDLKGSGMMSDSGKIYFKVENALKTYDKAIEQYGQIVEQDPQFSSAAKKIRAVIAKIDSKWIEIEDSEGNIKEFRDKLKKSNQCSQKAIDNLYKDRKQYDEIEKAYKDNKFVELESTGKSANLNNVDSVEYKVLYHAKEFNNFGKAISKTTFYKAQENCAKELSDNVSTSSDSYNATEEELKEQQKQFDDLNLNIWVGRWDHKLYKVTSSSSNSESKISSDFTMNLQTNKPVSISDPKNALKYEDIEADIKAIGDESGATGLNLLGGQTVAKTAKNKMAASELAKAAIIYQSNNRGVAPSFAQILNSGDVSVDTKSLLTEQLPAETYPDRIFYKLCDSRNFQISYWDYKLKTAENLDDYTCESSHAT